MSDFESLAQNRASSTSLVAAVWSGWASSQNGATAVAAGRAGRRRRGPGGGRGSVRGCGWAGRGSRAGVAERGVGGGGLGRREGCRAGSARRWSGRGCPPPALADEPGDRPAHAEFSIVGVGGDNKGVEHRSGLPGRSRRGMGREFRPKKNPRGMPGAESKRAEANRQSRSRSIDRVGAWRLPGGDLVRFRNWPRRVRPNRSRRFSHGWRGPPGTSDAPTARPRPVRPSAGVRWHGPSAGPRRGSLHPRPRHRRPDLRRTLTHAKKRLATGSQAGHGSPILSTC